MGIHALLTALGIGKGGSYAAVAYTLEAEQGRLTWESRFSPVALFHLLRQRRDPDPPTRMVVLLTPEAKKQSLPLLCEELARVGVDPGEAVEEVPISSKGDLLSLWEMFERVQGATEGVDALTLDITYGFRYIPFLYFLTVAFLTAVSNATLRGVFYGAEEGRGFVDLRPVMALAEWFYAMRAYKDGGTLVSLAKALKNQLEAVGRGNEVLLARVHQPLRHLAYLLSYGLPLEAGAKAAAVLDDLRSATPATAEMRPFAVVKGELEKLLQTLAAVSPRKETILLDEEELERQLRIIRWYMDHGQVHSAVGLMGEWLINVVLWLQGRATGWLEYGYRKSAKAWLNALRERRRWAPSRLTADEQRILAAWEDVRRLRNFFAHHGMTKKSYTAELENLHPLLEDLLRHPLSAQPSAPLQGRLLVSALGLNPGALFTAIRRTSPDQVLVVTSAEAEKRIPEMLQRAGTPSLPTRVFLLRDPFSPFEEYREIVQEMVPLLLGYEEVVANLTGGTTGMQFVVERICEHARKLGIECCQGVAVDRRPYAEQQADPYVEGEWIVVRGKEGDDFDDAEEGEGAL